MSASGPEETLRRKLLGLGFDSVGFARVSGPVRNGLEEWMAQGFHADMAWLERTAAKRRDSQLVLPGARSAILLGVNYWPGATAPTGADEPPGARRPFLARYAGYEDYHDTIKPALESAVRMVADCCGVGSDDSRYYVDTGPVWERGWAEKAGLGFLGKNGMLISRKFGNWMLLAVVLTRAELAPDVSTGDSAGPRIGRFCGKCTRCIDACPTRAFQAAGVIDARRCIAYQTIENKGSIPEELRPGIGTRVFGCDVCLEVCPWNRFARESRRLLLVAKPALKALSLREMLEMTPERFAEAFRRTPIKRLKLRGFLRNACVAAGNVIAADPVGDLIEPLRRLAAHPEPIVGEHARWAIGNIGGRKA